MGRSCRVGLAPVQNRAKKGLDNTTRFLSGKTGQGNRWLRSALIQAAHAAVKVKDSYLGVFYRRLVNRHGVKKAIVAVAHKLLIIAYTLLTKHAHYQDPGLNYLDARQKDQAVRRLRHRIEQLGYTVNLEPRTAVIA